MGVEAELDSGWAVAPAVDSRRHRFSVEAVGGWKLGCDNGFTDRDGTRPDWGKIFKQVLQEG